MTGLIYKNNGFRITSIVQDPNAGKLIQDTLSLKPEVALKIDEKHGKILTPEFMDAHGNLKAVIRGFVVETPSGKKILIDSCLDGEKSLIHMPEYRNNTRDMRDCLRDAGFSPADITDVLCTHMHADHASGNTVYEDGAWKPRFPNAVYHFSSNEYNFWKAAQANWGTGDARQDHIDYDTAIAPLMAERGRINVLNQRSKPIAKGVEIVPTPGHTPGHVSVMIDKRYLISGDTLHHVAQILDPKINAGPSDMDPQKALQSRLRILDMSAHGHIPLALSHGGEIYVMETADAYTFQPISKL